MYVRVYSSIEVLHINRNNNNINDWNSLPANIVNATSLNQFKNLLDEHWTNELFYS